MRVEWTVYIAIARVELGVGMVRVEWGEAVVRMEWGELW